MVNIFQVLHTLLSFLPLWFEIFLLAILAFCLVVIVFKVVAFVMDVIPFI